MLCSSECKSIMLVPRSPEEPPGRQAGCPFVLPTPRTFIWELLAQALRSKLGRMGDTEGTRAMDEDDDNWSMSTQILARPPSLESRKD